MLRFAVSISLVFACGTSLAAAQTPTFFTFPTGSRVYDVTYTTEPIAVGTTGSNAFRWSPSTGLVDLGPITSGTEVYVSADGNTIVADTTVGGFQTASRWAGGTSWTPITGLGGTSGTTDTISDGLSGDGSTFVGMGWISAGTAHGFSQTIAGGTVDLGSTVPTRSTRAKAVNADGSIIVGWQDSASGTRQGAMWIGGVQTLFTYTGLACGEAQGINASGSFVVGKTIFGGGNDGWQYQSSTGLVTLMPNLAGEAASLRASPNDVTDDGTIAVGTNGGNILGSKALIWINGVPQNYLTYLTTLGVTGVSGYSSLGIATAISGDGKAVVGWSTTLQGGPNGGWIVYASNTLTTSYCAGDGTGTACPCANSGATGNGCANSLNANGGRLAASGVASVTPGGDTWLLAGTGIPNGPGLYFQGTTQLGGGAGVTFGDGLRCVGGTVIRLGIVSGVANASTYPSGVTAPNNVPISQKGFVAAGDVRNYQLWYRDSDPVFCSGAVFNLTNAVNVTWVP